MTTARIRLAVATDFEAIAAITNHYIRTTAIHFGYDDVSAAELRAQWQGKIGLYPWLVTDLDGEVAGYAKAGPYRERSAYLYITETGIYLAPHHCGRGLGRPLYRRLLEVLRAQGFHSAIGGIALPNELSVRLHEELGFAACGIVREAGRKFDRWHDVGFWQLRLHPTDRATPILESPSQAFARTVTPQA
ncbi:MAG: N-acetyltransferase [Planctomycetes bacterium]|nr:N-acetyltransferase [Planctomycetota bacterium]